jgi:hypothetical protein
MVKIDQEYVYIPKGTGEFAMYPIEEIFFKTTNNGIVFYDTIRHLSSRNYCNENLCRVLHTFFIQLAGDLKINLEEDVLIRSLVPPPNDLSITGKVYDIFDRQNGYSVEEVLQPRMMFH